MTIIFRKAITTEALTDNKRFYQLVQTLNADGININECGETEGIIQDLARYENILVTIEQVREAAEYITNCRYYIEYLEEDYLMEGGWYIFDRALDDAIVNGYPSFAAAIDEMNYLESLGA